MFSEAWHGWLPTLADIIYRRTHGSENDQEYYRQFGFEQLEFTDCPLLESMRDRLAERFNEKYYDYKINAETLERWQMHLQVKADSINPRYERALRIYNAHATEMESDIRERAVTERVYEAITGGTDKSVAGGQDTSVTGNTSTVTSDGTSKQIDTPDSAINASDDYADSVSKSTSRETENGSVNGTQTYGRTDEMQYGKTENLHDTVTLTKEPEGGLVRSINDNIDGWKDIENNYIREYENNFLQIFWY